jgi:DNA-binding NarL/FixJ family response regulator
MSIRVLFASSDQAGSVDLQRSLLEASINLVCFVVEFASVSSVEALWSRVEANQDDVILLDWHLAEAETPELVRDVLQRNPRMHIVALLPQGYRQYRQSVWEAGACSSIPKEHMDQEWLSSILCVMYRAMQREVHLLQLTSG